MKTGKWITPLAVLVLILLIGGWMLRPDYSRRNYDFLPDMAYSPAYASLSANPNFPDGKTEQRPVPGTIAQGYPPFHYKATPEDARRAGLELTNPFPSTDALALQRGATVYSIYCQACHGATGAGDGTVVQRGFPPPPSLLADNARQIKDGQMYHLITLGQNNMPSYAAQVMRDDRWKVILFIRSLQAAAVPAAPTTTNATTTATEPSAK
ncbi:MAG: cytochrome c [Phycisphaerales bacterium]|jgi:mono/diheme cytochrome c family protein|nr:cytochrome c [Phycisphaerales bacterium]